MLLINATALLDIWYSRKDLLETVFSLWGQGQFYVDHVYYPPQEDMEAQPHTIACPNILQ